MKIYFVRHGKTEWNLEGRFQGYSGDSALLPEAFEEIQLLGQHLVDVPFDRICSSDLKRAHVTAELIQQAATTQKLSKPLPNFVCWILVSWKGQKSVCCKTSIHSNTLRLRTI